MQSDLVGSNFISSIGFPIAAFVMMLSLYLKMISISEKRQEKDDIRYETLVNKFIDSVQSIYKENKDAMEELKISIRELTSSVQEDTRQKDLIIQSFKECFNKDMYRTNNEYKINNEK